MSPLLMSTSSSNSTVTAWGANASGKSPSAVTTRATVDVTFEGSTRMRSPGATVPDTTLPAKPRKLRCGRNTTCTGKRKSRWFTSLDTSTVSRISSSEGPSYHGVACGARVTTFVPFSAEIGTYRISGMSSLRAKSWKLWRIWRKVSS